MNRAIKEQIKKMWRLTDNTRALVAQQTEPLTNDEVYDMLTEMIADYNKLGKMIEGLK